MDKFLIKTSLATTVEASNSKEQAEKRRKFNSDWTDAYFFVELKGKPQCLICAATVSEFHASKITRHYESQHADVAKKYPIGSEQRGTFIKQLKSQSEMQKASIRQVLKEGDAVSLASLKVCWRLARSKRAFTVAPNVKECIVDAVSILSAGT